MQPQITAHSAAAQVPPLHPRFLAPTGLRWQIITRDDGARLRIGILDSKAPSADILLACGFAEFIEKYFETMADFAKLDVRVWCMEWRNQGASRPESAQNHRPMARDFAADISDLLAVVDAMGRQHRPRLFIGHSMGAAIGLKALILHSGYFNAAVLSAPMIAVATSGLSPSIARAIVDTATHLGFGSALIPGSRVVPLCETGDAATANHATNDPLRGQLMAAWYKANPHLRIDGVTFAWYRSALTFCATFSDRNAFSTLTTPVLLGIPGQDVFVNPAPLYCLARTLPRCTLAEFPTAKHELFHEVDEVREPWMKSIAAFIATHALRCGS